MIRIALVFAIFATPTMATGRTAPFTPAPPAATPAAPTEPDAARMDLARTLVEVMQTEKQIRAAEEKTIANGAAQYDKYVPTAIATRLQIAAPRDYPAIRSNIVGLLTDEGQKLIDDSLPIEIDAFIRRYAQHYSADELHGLIAFYRSPLGQRVIAESPAMAEDNTKFQQGALKGIVASHVTEIGPKVAAMLAPLLARAGITTHPAGTPQQPSGYTPL